MPPGCILDGLENSWITFGAHLVSVLVPWASKMEATGNQADIAKAYENCWFPCILKPWEVILEAWTDLQVNFSMNGIWLARGRTG